MSLSAATWELDRPTLAPRTTGDATAQLSERSPAMAQPAREPHSPSGTALRASRPTQRKFAPWPPSKETPPQQAPQNPARPARARSYAPGFIYRSPRYAIAAAAVALVVALGTMTAHLLTPRDDTASVRQAKFSAAPTTVPPEIASPAPPSDAVATASPAKPEPPAAARARDSATAPSPPAAPAAVPSNPATTPAPALPTALPQIDKIAAAEDHVPAAFVPNAAPAQPAAATPGDTPTPASPAAATPTPQTLPASIADAAPASAAAPSITAKPSSVPASPAPAAVTPDAAAGAPAAPVIAAKPSAPEAAKQSAITAAPLPPPASKEAASANDDAAPSVVPVEPAKKPAVLPRKLVMTKPPAVPAPMLTPPRTLSPAVPSPALPPLVAALSRQADAGDAVAQYRLGVIYALGQDVPKDDRHAAALFRAAAESGIAEAQYNIGLLYADGQGVPRDASEAVRWYRRAAAQGNPNAAFNLGVAYGNGSGVAKSMTDAAQWFHIAAGAGVVNAQFNLALLYEHGEGLQESPIEAFAWYAAAASRGDQIAAQRRNVLAAGMSPDQRKQAASRAAELDRMIGTAGASKP